MFWTSLLYNFFSLSIVILVGSFLLQLVLILANRGGKSAWLALDPLVKALCIFVIQRVMLEVATHVNFPINILVF